MPVPGIQKQPSQMAIQRRMGQRGAQQSARAHQAKTSRLASRGEPTSSELARKGLLQAQAQKMQGGLPVGPEGGMPPSAKGALMLQAQQRMQDMLAQRQQAMEQQGMQLGTPQGAEPMGGPPPGSPQMGQQIGALQQGLAQARPSMAEAGMMQAPQPNMMDQQQRFQEVLKRLQQAQQSRGQVQPGVPL